MTTNKKIVTLAVLIVLAFGVLVYIKGNNGENSVAGTSSTAGSTFDTAHFAGTTINLVNAGANGTSTSILNSSAADRYVTALHLACQGIGSSFVGNTGSGLDALKMYIATTSAASPATLSTNNAVLANGIVSTGTPALLISSSTAQTATGATATSSVASIWNTGSYMTFFFNATNTALCTVGVSYING